MVRLSLHTGAYSDTARSTFGKLILTEAAFKVHVIAAQFANFLPGLCLLLRSGMLGWIYYGQVNVSLNLQLSKEKLK